MEVGGGGGEGSGSRGWSEGTAGQALRAMLPPSPPNRQPMLTSCASSRLPDPDHDLGLPSLCAALPPSPLLPAVLPPSSQPKMTTTSAAAASAPPADTSSLPIVDLNLYLADPSSAAGQAECEKVRFSCLSPAL